MIESDSVSTEQSKGCSTQVSAAVPPRSGGCEKTVRKTKSNLMRERETERERERERERKRENK